MSLDALQTQGIVIFNSGGSARAWGIAAAVIHTPTFSQARIMGFGETYSSHDAELLAIIEASKLARGLQLCINKDPHIEKIIALTDGQAPLR